MAARAGHTRDDVVNAALTLLEDGQSLDAVTLGAVARALGIKPQSLYAHVDGLVGLRRAIAVAGLAPLTEQVSAAVADRTGADAADAVVRAHLAFAGQHPALYEAVIEPPGGDAELEAATAAAGAPLAAALAAEGLSGEDAVHWTRLFLSSVYGYISLQQGGRFALPEDTASTEERLVAMLRRELDGLSRSQ